MARPNILLITTDQQRFDTIAALGNRDIYTPHLDWLTDEGITFSRAYTDCPICMPARATLMTGKHGYTIGLTGNSDAVQPMREHATLPGVLTRHGYQTRAQGKMHFAPMRANYGFEHMELPMDYYRERHRRPHEGLPKQHGVGENEIVPVISTVSETESLTHWTIERSIDFLETRDTTRPFFLWTSFTKPHPPFDPCANYWALYANKQLAEPRTGEWSARVADMPRGFLSPTYCLNNAYRATPEQLLDMRRAYYACITQIDYELGLLFARMRELELLENTWILFTSDHGEMLGDHHMGGKTVFLEGSAHVPLIIRPPARPWDEKPLAGHRCDSLAQLSDIMPTVLARAGIALPADLDGIDLMGMVEKPHADRIFFGQCADEQFAVMQGPWKYTWTCFGGEELLFNLDDDPAEQHNRVHDTDAAPHRERLRALLTRHLAEQGAPVVSNGALSPKPALTGPQDKCKWPGFHSTVCPSDVLH